MFWEKFIILCNQKGVAPNRVCADLGLSTAIATKWKNGAEPRSTSKKKIADYFGVSVDYLLGKEDIAPASPIENKKKELFGHIDQMTDEQLEQLKVFIKYLNESKNE